MSRAERKQMEKLLQEQYIRMQEIMNVKTQLSARSPLSVPMLRRFLNQLESKWEQYSTCHAEIQGLKTDEDAQKIYFQEEHLHQTMEVVEESRYFIWERLPDESSIQTSTRNDAAAGGSTTPVKLPPIALPSFNGEVTDWIKFRELFSSLVINNNSLSNIDRLHYLKSCLVGEVCNLVSDISLSESNFVEAWNLLRCRFDNNRALIYAYLKQFCEFPAITSDLLSNLKKLRDVSNSIRIAFNNLNIRQEDHFLVYLIVSKLDFQTRKEWEMHISDSTDFVQYFTLESFISSRIRALEAIPLPTVKNVNSRYVQPFSKKISVNAHQTSLVKKCCFCKGDHKIYVCDAFKNISVSSRHSFIRQSQRCINCLAKGHKLVDCPSRFSCKHCQKRHHGLLHQGVNGNANTSGAGLTDCLNSETLPQVRPSTSAINSHFNFTAESQSQPVLLATARVLLQSEDGRQIQVRALLDQGSEASFISERIVQLLRLPRSRVLTSISTVGTAVTNVSSSVKVVIKPIDNTELSLSSTSLVVPKITNYIPRQFSFSRELQHLQDLKLADPHLSSDSQIDFLLGADLYSSVLREGLRTGLPGTPVAQLTVFGWIISGPLPLGRVNSHSVHIHHAFDISLTNSLQKFWEIEEIPDQGLASPEDKECESHFNETHYRTQDGRYGVHLPFRKTANELGSSYKIALSSFLRLERRFQSNPHLKHLYSEFMLEYLTLGHMQPIPDHGANKIDRVFIPHHPVLKEGGSATTIRVVFNASCPTSNGISLNDILHKGPKLQPELSALILRWRLHRYVMSSDIAKMFRQILVAPEDRKFQCILWRNCSSEPIRAFELNTVTYGTVCAPFIANRVLSQLATDELVKYPLAAKIIKSDTYVDDVFFGADSLETVREMQIQVSALATSAGFHLHKWCSNSSTLLSDIDSSCHGLAVEFPFEDNASLKLLGICWSPKEDVYRFTVSPSIEVTISKRNILSSISKLFDPLGWLSPVIISAKILLQSLWLLKVSWDEELPQSISKRWMEIRDNLSALSSISIPRWIHYDHDLRDAELHGFADASISAYSAVVYMRILTKSGSIFVSLLSSKTKVSPIKTLSIPRLELCAASLLAKLIVSVQKSIDLPNISLYCWSDSTIVLSWLQKPAATWTTFVANRISNIQTTIPAAVWKHVTTKDNPADCASRGMAPAELINFSLWWYGPKWLSDPYDQWPSSAMTLETTTIEKRNQITSHLVQQKDAVYLRFSSWARLLRITAYMLKFINGARRKSVQSILLSGNEITHAAEVWIRRIQKEEFAAEISLINQNKELPKSSKLRSLNPFQDSSDILRVGGRLRHSSIQNSRLFPAILPRHYLSTLIVRQMHQNLLHAGTQLTLGVLRERYWIIGARSLVKSVIHNCVTCSRMKTSTHYQQMADLPSARCSPHRIFSHTGVDYAGPFHIRDSSGRGRKSHKSYIAVFVCFSTRAIHLELVNDYTSASFLASFRRFISRRGIPSDIYSDNATNFYGANKELSLAFRAVMKDPNLRSLLANDGTTWHFLPPSAPHFGGLWEAGVKSVKTHLRKMVGTATLTYEEFLTLLTQIECCLNSRPIAPLNDECDTLEVLTPGHFLIGTSLKSIPEPSVLNYNENRLSRWQLVQHLTERFWRMWCRDYLFSLQQRHKWIAPQPNIKCDEIVLLKNKNLPPTKWELGRVISCNPGRDKLVRVVTIKTANAQYVRPITQICRLPGANSL